MSISKIFWINIELRSPSAFKCIAASGNEEPIPQYIQSLVVIIKILLMEPINTRHQCWKFFWTCSLVPSFRLLGSCGEISTWRSEYGTFTLRYLWIKYRLLDSKLWKIICLNYIKAGVNGSNGCSCLIVTLLSNKEGIAVVGFIMPGI